MRKVNFDPPVNMGKGWTARFATTQETDEPIFLVCLETWSSSIGSRITSARLDVAKGIFIDAPPIRFTKKAVARLVEAICSKSSILEQVGNDLRGWLAGQVPGLADLAKSGVREKAKPAVVREVEEMLRNQAFGCYTAKVAKLCGKLVGHEISLRLEPPKPYPPGSFLVATTHGNVILGETLFVVGGVRGFGENIFREDLGMKIDGTVGGCLRDDNSRPATQREIRQFVAKANVRALVVLAEILERKGK